MRLIRRIGGAPNSRLGKLPGRSENSETARLDPDQTAARPARYPLPDPRIIPSPVPDSSQPKTELKAFLFLTVVMAPLLAGAIIGTYGLFVWIYQMFMGPPTGG